MKSVLALLASAGAVLISNAAAQGEDSSLGSVYARVGGGVSFVSDWDQDITRPPDAVTCQGIGCNADRQVIELDQGFVAAAALGFDYADGIRTELEYRYANAEISGLRLFEGGVEVGGSPPNDEISSHFLMTNFYFDFSNQSPFTPFIGGGVGGAFTENPFGQRDAALAYQARAGLSYEFAGGFLADLEYVYLRTNELSYGTDIDDFGPDGPTAPNIGGDRYEASSVMMSLRKHF